MRDEILPARIICEGGLNTSESSLSLSNDLPGGAVKLVNFEASTSGGYRRINGFAPYSPDFPLVAPDEAEGKVLGVFIFWNTEKRAAEVFAARKILNEEEYGIFKLNHSGWVRETLPSPRLLSGSDTNVNRLRFEVYNAGGGNNLFAVDGVNPLLWYNGEEWEEIVIEGQNQQAINSPMVVCVFKNHLFVACDQGDQTVIAHSAPNNPSDWSSASGAGQLFPGFEVQNIRPFRDELFVFGLNKIRKIIVTGVDFTLHDVTNDLGCVARDSILEVAGNLIFLSQDGIRPIAGTERISDLELGLLSENIQPDMQEIINQGDLETFHGLVIKTKTQFRYFFSNEVVPTKEASGIIGSLRSSRRMGRNWEFSSLVGIRASCSWSGMISGRETVIHGDFDGSVYLHDVGSSFNGESIYSLYQTPYLDFGNTEVRKTFRTFNLFYQNDGLADIALGISYDWGSPASYNPSNEFLTPNTKTSFFDRNTSLFGNVSTVYGFHDQSKLKQNITGSGESVSFTFLSDGVYDPFTIQGFVIEYSEKGRQ